MNALELERLRRQPEHGTLTSPTSGQIEQLIDILKETNNLLRNLSRCVETARPDAPGRGHYLRVVQIPEPIHQ